MEDVVEDSDEGETAADSGADVVLTPLRDDAAVTFTQHQGRRDLFDLFDLCSMNTWMHQQGLCSP